MALKKVMKIQKKPVKKGAVMKTKVNNKSMKKVKDKDTEFIVGHKELLLKLPKGWDQEKALEVTCVKLDVSALDHVYVPLTKLEQAYGLVPKIYSEDVNGAKIKAVLNSYPNDLDWRMIEEITLKKLLFQPIRFLRGCAASLTKLS